MKDLTKYRWNGQIYGKSKLIEAIITDYILTKNILTFKKLKEIFPKEYNGKYEVVQSTQILAKNDIIRYFTNEYIILADGTNVVITNQWGKDNIHNIFILFKKLGYKFRKVTK